MALFEVMASALSPLEETSFSGENLRERDDLQRLLRDRIEVVAPLTLVLSEEFGDWQESRRRIDLLALDKLARLVVIELKRSEDGGHMELQALRYAAMVSSMSFKQAVDAHQAWLERRGIKADARQRILEFLEWEDLSGNEQAFASEVRIVLVSADFSRELTTTVLWLTREYELDVTCVRLKAYRLDDRLILDAQRIIPLPEAADYIERVREKERAERESRASSKDYTRFDVTVRGQLHERQPKNCTLLLIVRALCQAGVTPEQIAEVVPWKRIWKSCPGQHRPESFVRELTASDPTFDPYRWFCDTEELIQAGGQTYALTSMWGGQRTIDAIFELARRWPNRGVSVAQHEPAAAAPA
jgi:hypothetical protein